MSPLAGSMLGELIGQLHIYALRVSNDLPSIARLLLAIIAVTVSLATHAQTITGKVVGISDGDTVTVLDASRTQHKIRLAGIDAPERRQAFGNVSKQNLSREVFKKEVTVDYDKRDRHRRIVGKVFVEGADVCLRQIEDGLA
jgi:endonuclease YncB( thermonuclease family)